MMTERTKALRNTSAREDDVNNNNNNSKPTYETKGILFAKLPQRLGKFQSAGTKTSSKNPR